MKIAFHTLGCKVNFYETEAMAELFKARGHERVEETDFADAYVVNTCSVTNLADRKSRQYIRRMLKINPEAVIAVAGCYSQVKPEEVAAVEGVDIVLGTRDKNRLVDLVEKALANRSAGKPVEAFCGVEPYGKSADYAETGTTASMENRTRAYLKIQEGCNRFCSYCIIPYARGPVRSRELSAIVDEAKALLAAGFKELVLTGINTALYGAERGSNIEEVIAALNELPGEFRIRLSSLEPTVVNADFVKNLFKYDKLAHHLHLSAQSGSNRTLAAMNRHYTREDYQEIVDALFAFDPCYGISTDIIAGFPGETEEDFCESLSLTEAVDFCKVHAFNYSKRSGTAAESMPGHLDPRIKARRAAELLAYGEKSSERFFRKNIGESRILLVEEYLPEEDLYVGYTDNYIRTYTKSGKDLRGEFVRVKFTELYRDGLLAELEKGEAMDCIFCALANKEIPTEVVYEDEKIFCFKDMAPQAPVHVLIIPKKHIASLDELAPEDADLVGYIFLKAKEIAASQGITNGYRVVCNCGEDGDQTVKHLHFHLLGKRKLSWPPG